VRGGITVRLFGAMLACIALVLGIMLTAQRLGFQHSFLSYLSQQEVERAESLVQGLSALYREQGSWQALRRDHRLWRRLLWQHQHPAGESPADSQPDVLALAPRLTLLDHRRALVIGNPRPAGDAVHRAILVEDVEVGWLVISPYTRLTDAVDLQFEAQQRRVAWLGALLAVVLAGLTAVLLARWFVAPLQRVAAASRQLGAGDYRVRVPISGRDELASLGRDFNRLATALEANEQARRDFMADIAHELRTPLTVLRGELEALVDGVRPVNRPALVSLQQEVATLSQLVEDLRQLALSDRGGLSYHLLPLDFAELVADEVQAGQPALADAGLELDHRPAPGRALVRGDRERLRQLLRNLLTNSQRYTDAPGRVRVRLAAAGPWWRLTVEDSAPGVPPEHLDRLFERLHRLEASRSRRSGGSGLGLAIAQAIARAHGGDIAARASELGGLAVEVTLPREESDHASSHPDC